MFITGKSIDFINDIELNLYCKDEGVSLSDLKKTYISKKKKNIILRLFTSLFN